MNSQSKRQKVVFRRGSLSLRLPEPPSLDQGSETVKIVAFLLFKGGNKKHQTQLSSAPTTPDICHYPRLNPRLETK